MAIYLDLFTLLLIATFYCESSGCFSSELIKPCICKNNGIICGGHSDIDLVNIFQTLEKKLTTNEKHFDFFQLSDTLITELKENTFKDITFDQISIYRCNNLSKIHINAFTGTQSVTKILNIFKNSILSSSDNSIFEVISKFVSLEYLELVDNNITEIPSNAFLRKKGNQNNLENIVLGGRSIETILPRAFYSLKGLNFISIYDTSIDYIPEYTFEFENESAQKLTLSFADNVFLNSSSFQQDSLMHFKRPVYIELGSSVNHFEYLDENVFENFLVSNPKNVIDMTWVNFDCNNCKNFWLRRQSHLLNRIMNLKCSNKNLFNDTDNFADCPYQNLQPCNFVKSEQAIYCGGDTDIDLKAMFHQFSKDLSNNKKHFKRFYLNNTYIKVLEENTFDEITFDEIEINNCLNLTYIERYVFNTTDRVMKNIFIVNNNLNMETRIFEILSSFVNIEFIYLNEKGLNEIPSKAFQPINGYQERLKHLFLGYFVEIGKIAFSNLKNLVWLTFSQAEFDSMPDYTFEFEEHSNDTFHLRFLNKLNISAAFNQKTLLNIRRPTKLNFHDLDNIKFLDQDVFLPFLLDDERNTIDVSVSIWKNESEEFDCNDCRNYWIIKNQNLTKRVTANCSNKKQLNDPDNFKKCK